MFDGLVDSDRGRFFSLPPGGGNKGGGARGLTCGSGTKGTSHPFAAGVIVYPADGLPDRAVAKSLNQLRRSHWATRMCLAGRARVRARY